MVGFQNSISCDAGEFFKSLIMSLCFWAIMGAFAYRDRRRGSPEDLVEFVELMALILVPICFFIFIGIVIGSCHFYLFFPVATDATLAAGGLAVWFTTTHHIMTEALSKKSGFQTLFCIMSSVYVGWLLELVTGLLTSFVRYLEARGH